RPRNAHFSGGTMHTTTRTTAAAAGLFAALILTGCGSAGVGQAGEPAATVTATVEPTEVPEPGAGVPAECREWIEGELLDATEGINAGTGYAACGDLSDDEMDQAVDTVTEELMAEGKTPGDQYGDGDYQVGEDIPAGTY